MEAWKIVELNFDRCPAHFGELGIGMEATSERVYSDTLFSAWMSAYARLYPDDIDGLLNRFLQEDSPPIRLSSTFIYQRNEHGTIYYLPRPLRLPLNYPSDDLAFFKTYKSLNHLPIKIWQRWYQGEGFTAQDKEELIAKTTKAHRPQENKLESAAVFSYKQAFTIAEVPKTAIDRVTGATNLYHVAFVHFAWEEKKDRIDSQSGLYFLVNFSHKDKSLSQRLENALHLLGEQGIGGERSSGAGRFQAQWLDLAEACSTWQEIINYSAKPVHYSLISLCWDNNKSWLEQLIDEPQISYELKERGGWIVQSNIRRQKLLMFNEGSVFPEQPQGKLIDVTPSQLRNQEGGYKTHPIYRSGISLSLPIKVSNS